MILATFDLQVIPIVPTMFCVNWPLGSEEEQNRFSRYGGHLGYPIRMILVLSPTSPPDTSYQVLSQLAFPTRRRCAKKDFQDGGYGGHPGFKIGPVLAFFSVSGPDTSYQVPIYWPFGSEETQKSRWQPSWISYWNDFSYF